MAKSNINPYVAPETSQRSAGNQQASPQQSHSWLKFGLAVVLVVFAVATRPQLQFGAPLWNFSPLVAVALFAGAFFRKGWAFAIPFVAMLISDVVIEMAFRLGYTETWGFYAGMLYNYPAYALLVCLGMLLRKPYEKLSERGVTGSLSFFGLAIGTGLVGSVVFFLVTNFGAWIEFATRYNAYPLTFAGLMECYAAGLAFYRQQGTMFGMGDLIYTAVLFGSFLLAARFIPQFSGGKHELALQRVAKDR